MTQTEKKARTALQEAVKRWGLPKIADEFNVNSRTLVRWKEGSIPHPGMVLLAANGLLEQTMMSHSQNQKANSLLLIFLLALVEHALGSNGPVAVVFSPASGTASPMKHIGPISTLNIRLPVISGKLTWMTSHHMMYWSVAFLANHFQSQAFPRRILLDAHMVSKTKLKGLSFTELWKFWTPKDLLPFFWRM